MEEVSALGFFAFRGVDLLVSHLVSLTMSLEHACIQVGLLIPSAQFDHLH